MIVALMWITKCLKVDLVLKSLILSGSFIRKQRPGSENRQSLCLNLALDFNFCFMSMLDFKAS